MLTITNCPCTLTKVSSPLLDTTETRPKTNTFMKPVVVPTPAPSTVLYTQLRRRSPNLRTQARHRPCFLLQPLDRHLQRGLRHWSGCPLLNRHLHARQRGFRQQGRSDGHRSRCGRCCPCSVRSHFDPSGMGMDFNVMAWMVHSNRLAEISGVDI